MNGLGKGNHRDVMTPDIAGGAVPKLLPLLKHEDLYVREGALMALSNCGKEAAKHLDKIVPLADDDDWWVRAGVAYVLHHVDQPETGNYVSAAVRSMLAEQSVYARNRIRGAVGAVDPMAASPGPGAGGQTALE